MPIPKKLIWLFRPAFEIKWRYRAY